MGKLKNIFLVLLIYGFGLPTSHALLLEDGTSRPEIADGITIKYRDVESNKPAAVSARVKAFAALKGISIAYGRTGEYQSHILSLGGIRPLKEVAAIAKQLTEDANVLYAEPNTIAWPAFTPNDSSYSLQWHYYESTGGVNLPLAWDKTMGSGVVVAVVDTGYRPHVDLANNIIPGFDFISNIITANDGNGRDIDASDPGDWNVANECAPNTGARNSSWHGTHVSGTVAAITNNSGGVAGVAGQAKISPVRVLGKCGGNADDVAAGVRWAAGLSVSGVPNNTTPAKVINMSLGGPGACPTNMQNAITDARNQGATIVVAAGNNNMDASSTWPANCAGAVVVSATNRNGGKASYSNYGSIVALAAPGGEMGPSVNGVYSTLNSGTTTPGADSYAYYQGTSMATPHVSGIAALLYALKPAITPDQVKSILQSTARAFPGTCIQCGAGIVNAASAVTQVAPPVSSPGWLPAVLYLLLQ